MEQKKRPAAVFGGAARRGGAWFEHAAQRVREGADPPALEGRGVVVGNTRADIPEDLAKGRTRVRTWLGS
jgi:hypothetical protein